MLLACTEAAAQRFSLSTDILATACLGTLNADVSMNVSRKLSLCAGVRYNPFTYMSEDPQKQFQYRQRSFSAGLRMWPWHTGSGWWLSGKLRYQEYCFGGLLSRQVREGDRAGAGLYAGYTHMLSSCFNIEFGVGAWMGVDLYRKYDCQVCGRTLASGNSFFILPDDVMISLVYVF